MTMKRILAAAALMLGMSAFAQSKTQVEFWTWYLSPKFDSYIQGVIADFEAQNPDISVKWLDKQDSMVQDFITAMNLQMPPDVVNLNIDETAAAAQNGFLTPLTDLTTQDALAQQFWPNPLANFTVDGTPYGYPWYGWLNQGVMMYNADLFAKAGIDTLPTTTDEMIAASKTIKDATGAYGWVPRVYDITAPNEGQILGTFYEAGLPVVDASGQAIFDSPDHVAVLQRYVDLFTGGYVPEDALRKDPFQLQIQLYSQGQLGAIIGGPQALTRIKDANASIYDATAIAPAPLGAAGVETGGGMDLVIPDSSRNKEAAAKFAAFMTNNDNQVKFASVVAIVPTTKGAESADVFTTDSKDPQAVATAMVGTKGRLISPGYTPPANSSDIIKHLNDDVAAALLGKMSAQQALQDAVKFWNANLGM